MFKKLLKTVLTAISPSFRIGMHSIGEIKKSKEELSLTIQQINDKIDKIDNDFIKSFNYIISFLEPQRDHFSGHYEFWRIKRIKAIVEHYGENWFKGKKILELGCGYGDIGLVFRSLGSEVVFSEGRSENVEYLRRKFPQNRIYLMNCENEWPFSKDEHFDLILHMGLLYHLDNIFFALDHCLECSDNIVLETEVSDSDDENYILKIDESKDGYDQSLIGHGSRPSAEYIEKHIKQYGKWNFERITDSRCNASFHRYDWSVNNTGKWENGLRRFWFLKRQ